MATASPPPDEPTATLFRPVGPEELELVRASGWRAWPPRLPGQPIFYPVLNEDYATKIARDWNVAGPAGAPAVQGCGRVLARVSGGGTGADGQ